MDDVVDAAVDAATEIQEEAPAPAPAAAKPKRKSRAKALASPAEESETPRIERKLESDSMLFSNLLKTQRAMEKEARSSKISSLRIV
jgi:hypothetical protein